MKKNHQPFLKRNLIIFNCLVQLSKYNRQRQIHNKIPYHKLRSNSTNPRTSSFQEKVGWLIKNSDYTSYTQKTINQQHNSLRQLLKQINSEVAKYMESIRYEYIKTPRKQLNTSDIMIVRNKQSQNNKLILGIYKEQYSNLQKRMNDICQSLTIQSVEKQINDMIEKIQKIKLENKQLKKNNLLRGNTIVNQNPKIKQIRLLETQKHILEAKKIRISEDLKNCQTQLIQTKRKSNQLTLQSQKADKFLQQQLNKEQLEKQSQHLEEIFNEKKNIVQFHKKKLQSINAVNQHKYLAKLKELENSASNLKEIQEKVLVVDGKIAQSKKTMSLIEEITFKNSQMKLENTKNEEKNLKKQLKRYSSSVEVGTENINSSFENKNLFKF